ncbi:alpha/beta fold hydrolase BchO [Histidinibacterium lentulum]|uniref:Alpha/beta fold hydrolase n=1 Tax=Histidinibacterium lentulum TaxID=2480588 RepID=A0A3N2R740_9RHOB|nr:alpha/beta fold hydrolase BchO [Histidinibacterium lentulum]ROU03146.1 alpha/beta fold hydrolase [Histidinibacterium lentulum]
MRWPEDAQGWPLTKHSRFVLCRPHRWHVQEAGTGPTLVLIHGAGGATQSWRGLFPRLADSFHVVAVDLPGQGFSQCGARARLGLDGVAEDLGALLAREGWRPAALIGHSAGAAVALRMALTEPVPVLAINPALQNFRGAAGWLFPMLAKVLALNPFSASLFTGTVTRSTVRRLIEGTGSRLGPEGLDLYYRLVRDRGHVDGVLGMMSQWSLEGLLARRDRIGSPVRCLVGLADGAVPPASVRAGVAGLRDVAVEEWDGLGHLMHEEAPDRVADWVRRTMAALPPGTGIA